jgi:hypothetical protein
MRVRFAWAAAALCAACGPRSSYVRVNDVPLGRVVVYRNGIAYYERAAHVERGTLKVSVPRALVDDFLKSLTVADARTKQALPVRFPRDQVGNGDTIQMSLQVPAASADVLMTYVTAAPAWKPSYRMVIGKGDKVFLEGWAIIDNTSGEDWKDVQIGVGASSAMSFRFDLWSVRSVEREELHDDERFAAAPPTALAPLPAIAAPGAGAEPEPAALVGDGYGVSFSGASSLENQYVVDGAATDAVETVTVTGQAPTIDPTSSSQGITIDKEYTKNLPRPGRTFEAALGSAAGAQGDSTGAAVTPPDPRQLERDAVARLAKAATANHKAIAITTFARAGAPTPGVVEQARRVRDTLVDVGVPTAHIVQHAQTNAPMDTLRVELVPLGDVAPAAVAASDTPIGEELFTAPGLMTVPSATSAMVPILRAETQGEVVYLYDAVSARGNDRYAFRAVHLINPTDSTLEGGPISVYGQDHFIGEGMTDQVPPHGTSVVPFALDRQVVVESHAQDERQLRRIIAAERGIVRAEMQDQRTTSFTVQSRLTTPTTVYVVHRQSDEWQVTKAPGEPERIAGALLYAVHLKAGERRTVEIRETRPLERELALAAPETTELLATYVATPDADPALKAKLDGILGLHRQLVDQAQAIENLRERAGEYRARQDELSGEIVALAKARTGGELARHLQQRLREISDRIQTTTIAIVDAQEQTLVTRVQYADAIAELHLADLAAPVASATP